MPIIKCNDIDINCIKKGEGEPLVLIQGINTKLEAWNFQIEFFKRIHGHSCILFELTYCFSFTNTENGNNCYAAKDTQRKKHGFIGAKQINQ